MLIYLGLRFTPFPRGTEDTAANAAFNAAEMPLHSFKLRFAQYICESCLMIAKTLIIGR